MEETCEILDHAEILKGFITNANYEGFKAYIESDEVDIRTINSLVGGSILLFFSEIHSEIHSNHDEEDMKNKKKKKITATDIQNELNSLINKVRMMEEGKGENEIEEKEIIEKEIIVENKFI